MHSAVSARPDTSAAHAIGESDLVCDCPVDVDRFDIFDGKQTFRGCAIATGDGYFHGDDIALRDRFRSLSKAKRDLTVVTQDNDGGVFTEFVPVWAACVLAHHPAIRPIEASIGAGALSFSTRKEA